MKELKRKLLQEAKEYVIAYCASKLRDAINVAPYRYPDAYDPNIRDDDEDWDFSNGYRVMGIAFANDLSLAAFACIVDIDGEVSDVLRLPNLLKRKSGFRPEDREAKEKDLKNLYDFMYKRRPHVVVIGAESREGVTIKEEIGELIRTLVEEENFPLIPVEFMNNDLARIYANSIKGQADFKEYPELLRQAISLARRLQDPLLEFTQLCTPDEELVCVKFHSLQDHVTKDDTKDEYLLALYEEIINQVNAVGVDFNRCLDHPYTCNLLQFVAGLGPRKAAFLLKVCSALRNFT
jgi:transcription elongation factor SPT6